MILLNINSFIKKDEITMKIKDIVGRKLDMTDRIIVRKAIERGVEITKLPNKRFEMKYDNKKYIIRNGRITNSYNSKLAQKCTDMKEVTSRLMRSKGFPSPENAVFNSKEVERAWNWAKEILPIVLKPTNGMMGRSVYVNIQNYEEFKECYNKIALKHNEVLVEQFVQGNEYRFTVLKGNVVGIANRIPANIIGDGKSTINQLIDQKNLERINRQNPRHKKLIKNGETDRVLKKQGYDLSGVPKRNEIVFLRNNSNISTGGDAIDVTDEINPLIKEQVEKAVKSIPGLRVCGVDVIINGNEFYILEINSYAMLSMHHYPWVGKPRNVIDQLIEEMFPRLEKIHTKS